MTAAAAAAVMGAPRRVTFVTVPRRNTNVGGGTGIVSPNRRAQSSSASAVQS